MVKLLLYAYCTGKPSCRRIAKATWEEIPYRVLTADQHPDHDTIASFRKRHLKVLARLLYQLLLLCCASWASQGDGCSAEPVGAGKVGRRVRAEVPPGLGRKAESGQERPLIPDG